MGLNDGRVGFAGLERQIGVFRKRFGFWLAGFRISRFLLGRFWFFHGMGPSMMGVATTEVPGPRGYGAQVRDLSCSG